MPTLQEIHAPDSIGITRFTDKQLQGMVSMLKRTGKLESDPPKCKGQGIIIAGGGPYLSWAWICCRVIRSLGCQLPIEVWHLNEAEMPAWAKPRFSALGARTVNASEILKRHPHRMLSQYIAQKRWKYAGWVLKTYAVEHCPWEEVIFTDADCFASVNPETLLAEPEIKEAGSLFFSDIKPCHPGPWAYIYCALEVPVKEWESGCFLVNKKRGWMGLRWTNWLNEHADTLFQLVMGDKGTLELGFRLSKVPHIFSQECSWHGWGISQQWSGREWFRHAMAYKRNEHQAPSFEIQQGFWDWESLAK